MDIKKNDDYVVQMPDTRSEEHGALRDSNSRQGLMAEPMSKLENSPHLSILAYCLSSISMTVVNKYVVSGSSWNMTFFYLAIQSIVCISAITICKHVGLIRALAPYDTTKGRKWFPVALLLVCMIYTGTRALQFLSVPVYTIFKNLTIIVIAYGEMLWAGRKLTSLTLLSFGLMILSSVIAAWADVQHALSSDMKTVGNLDHMSTLNAGYMWMGLNVLSSACFTLGMRKVAKKMNFKDWDTTFYNNLLTIPVLVICSLVTEDWSRANLSKNFPTESRIRIITGMIYSGLGATFISYCSAWCLRVTSSTTYAMVGALNKLPIAISGIIFFSAPVTIGSVSAIFIGFVSGIVYTIARLVESGTEIGFPQASRFMAGTSSQSRRDTLPPRSNQNGSC